MGERRGVDRVYVMERDHLEDTSIDGKIMLRWIFRKWYMPACTRSNWLGLRTIHRHL
jgi:hypothetical protein